MTPRNRWPNEAEWARLEAIANARNIKDAAVPIREGERMTDTELVRRAGRIVEMALEILLALTAVGPGKGNK